MDCATVRECMKELVREAEALPPSELAELRRDLERQRDAYWRQVLAVLEPMQAAIDCIDQIAREKAATR